MRADNKIRDIAKVLTEDIRINNGLILEGTPEQIQDEIREVDEWVEALRSWNLKYDDFPRKVYTPNLPYGVEEAEEAQREAMRNRADSYHNTGNIKEHYASNAWSKMKDALLNNKPKPAPVPEPVPEPQKMPSYFTNNPPKDDVEKTPLSDFDF
jgi:hypothetical protein